MHKHFAASFLRCPYSWLEDVFRKRTRRFNRRIGLHLNFFKSIKNKQCQVLSIINVSVKFSSVIHLTVDNYYLRDFGFISISV